MILYNYNIMSYIILVIVIALLILSITYVQSEQFKSTPNDKPILALFSKDWCSHCRDFKPTWKKLQTMDIIQSIVTTAELNPEQYGVTSFPTIRLYTNPIQSPDQYITYTGQRNLGEVIKFLKKTL